MPPSRRTTRPSAAARRAAALARAGGASGPAGATAAGVAPGPVASEAPPALAAEDALLVVWVLFGSRVVESLPGFSADAAIGAGAAASAAGAVVSEPSVGLFLAIAQALGPGGWLIVLSMLFCFFTRGPEDVDLDTAILRRFLFVPPAFWLLGIFAMALNAVRYGLDVLLARWRGRGTAGVVLRKGWPGWPLASRTRRLGALPAILGGEWAFRSAVLESPEAWGAGTGDPYLVAMTVVWTVPAFVVFVVAPRLATGGVLKVWPWVVRFAVYLATVWAADHWLVSLLG